MDVEQELHEGRAKVAAVESKLIIMNIFISPKLVVQYIHEKARTKLT